MRLLFLLTFQQMIHIFNHLGNHIEFMYRININTYHPLNDIMILQFVQ